MNRSIGRVNCLPKRLWVWLRLRRAALPRYPPRRLALPRPTGTRGRCVSGAYALHLNVSLRDIADAKRQASAPASGPVVAPAAWTREDYIPPGTPTSRPKASRRGRHARFSQLHTLPTDTSVYASRAASRLPPQDSTPRGSLLLSSLSSSTACRFIPEHYLTPFSPDTVFPASTS